MSEQNPPDPGTTGGGYTMPPVRTREEGLLETVIAVFTTPVPTLRRVTRQAKVGWAIAVLLTIGLFSALASYATFGAEQPWLDQLNGADPFADIVFAGWLRSVFVVVQTIATPIIGAFIALILHGVARLFKGQGTYAGIFAGLAFAYVPTLLQVPLQLLSVAGGLAGAIVAGLLVFAIFAWTVVLAVIAVRENYTLSTGKSVAVVLIPMAVGFVLAIVLAVIIVALAFAAFGAA